jgi:hypothetical protein
MQFEREQVHPDLKRLTVTGDPAKRTKAVYLVLELLKEKAEVPENFGASKMGMGVQMPVGVMSRPGLPARGIPPAMAQQNMIRQQMMRQQGARAGMVQPQMQAQLMQQQQRMQMAQLQKAQQLQAQQLQAQRMRMGGYGGYANLPYRR